MLFWLRAGSSPLSGVIGRTAYQLLTMYAMSHGLRIFDSLIAATAIEHQMILLTRNRKHYQAIAELSLEVPHYDRR